MDAHGGLGFYIPLRKEVENRDGHNDGHDCFCNFFRTPKPDEIYVPPDNYLEATRLLSNVMSTLPRKWPKRLRGASKDWENPNLPSGYTYLAQLVAHDVVQTSLVSPRPDDDHHAFSNNRTVKLDLDTLYGAHPRAARQAYAIARNGDRYRTKLSVGPMGRSSDRVEPATPPLRDIGRTEFRSCEGDRSRGLTEPALADTRNDNNSNLSQLATVFSHLHNGVLNGIDRLTPIDKNISPLERDEQMFAEARQVVERLYRAVVREDLLKRMLHPRVYKHYCQEKPEFISDSSTRQMSLEFAQAAFRFGHAMIRPDYHMSPLARNPKQTVDVLLFNSTNRPWRMPLDESWIIAWSEFFDLGAGSPRNLSCRIGPNFSGNLESGRPGISSDSPNPTALAHRDLMRSASIGVWSVNALIKALRKQHDEFFEGSEFYAKPANPARALNKWFKWAASLLPDTDGNTNAFKALADDPPLSFYILFESARECEGRHLGTLGSIIVAETLFQALDVEPLDPDDEERIDYLTACIFGPGKIDTMPALLRATASVSGLANAKPPFLF